MKEIIKITDIKDMLRKTGEEYGNNIAYKIKIGEGKYKTITHKEVREEANALGTALIDMGLKDKRIAIIGENRYEWEIAYLSIVCGTGIVVPFDKALPENELRSLIERSNVEAIFFSGKYEDIMKNIYDEKLGKLKYYISMDLKESNEMFLSQKELTNKGWKLMEGGDRRFLDAEINPEAMNVMLFTSGTTAKSKVVALCHRNICANLMDMAHVIDLNPDDVMLSFLPLHHIFECTVGFLFSLYRGAQTCFSDGARFIIENLNEYHITFMASVPAIYEMMYKHILKKLEKENMLDKFESDLKESENMSMEEKKKKFQYINDILGGHIRTFISGAAALDPVIWKKYREMGINLLQGYGLTETSPVIAVETPKLYRQGSIGKCLPSVEVGLIDKNADGMGELIVKGPNIMLGYFEDDEATKEAIDSEGWFKTGDLAKIDDDGYIYICGRKKSVIVLQNGKNIFPEEMENLLNKIDGVKESFIYGKYSGNDKEDVRIYAKLVYDKAILNSEYNAFTEEEITKALYEKVIEVNRIMPKYKAIRGIVVTETPLIKTTTSKIKRQEEMKTIL